MFLLGKIPCYIWILRIKIGTSDEIWSNVWTNCTGGSVKIVLKTIQKAKLIENQVKNYFQIFFLGIWVIIHAVFKKIWKILIVYVSTTV